MLRSALVLAAALAAPAAAQEPGDRAPAFRVAGSVALVSDYRRRGVSWSDAEPAVTADLELAHRSGAHVGIAVASVRGWGSAGGSDVALDFVAGWRLSALGGDIDAGGRWVALPGGLPDSDYGELYGRYSGTIGPLFLRAGLAWAPKQTALGRRFDSGADFAAGNPQRRGGGDNLYLEGDASAFLPGTPVTLHGHVGHSRGNAGLGPAGTSLAPTGRYWDWRIGADVVAGPITLGLAWVATDIDFTGAAARRLLPPFGRSRDGGPIAGSTAVVTLSASF